MKACNHDYPIEFSTPSIVTNFFLHKSWEEKKSITILKLLKIMWFSYGYWLALENKKFFPEDFEAWKHGPVLTSVYHEFKRFGRQPIPENTFSQCFDPYKEEWVYIKNDGLTNSMEKFLHKIWDMYKNFTASQLVDLTHVLNGPWDQVYDHHSWGKKIDNHIIKKYFNVEVHKIINNEQKIK